MAQANTVVTLVDDGLLVLIPTANGCLMAVAKLLASIELGVAPAMASVAVNVEFMLGSASWSRTRRASGLLLTLSVLSRV